MFTTDDVAGSAGTFGGRFRSVSTTGNVPDDCKRKPEVPYTVKGVGMRHVTQRNAPTVVNAGFNHRNFWDLRASHIFNGRNPFGERDPGAFVWIRKTATSVAKQRLALANASLASQAVGPPLDSTEMSCAGRTFADIGRRLLGRRALELQEVHPEDSVLGAHRQLFGEGLVWTYETLIQSAFNSRYWDVDLPENKRKRLFGKPAKGAPYTMTEANFSMFFGLAVKLYVDTLVSDQTPFDSERTKTPDEYGNYYPKALNGQQRRGLKLFLDAHCGNCHTGPTLSTAAHPKVIGSYNPEIPADKNYAARTFYSMVDRRVLDKGFGLIDRAAANTSVTGTVQDPGIGGKDPFGHPLSFAAQYTELLKGNKNKVIDPFGAKPCNFSNINALFTNDFKPGELASHSDNGCSPYRLDSAFKPKPGVAKLEDKKPDHGRLRSGVGGAFKIPTLRNVELTGPYMHNGSMSTLEQVVEFYRRGGNFANRELVTDSVFNQQEFIFSKRDAADLVAFLKSLTDERVRWEKAPFDHPSLLVPHGGYITRPDANKLAQDRFLEVPAVGRTGRTKTQGPLKPYAQLLLP